MCAIQLYGQAHAVIQLLLSYDSVCQSICFLGNVCCMSAGDTAGETVADPTEQQGGGEVIQNPDAPEASDNPDGYLAEEEGTGAEGTNEPDAMPAKS